MIKFFSHLAHVCKVRIRFFRYLILRVWSIVTRKLEQNPSFYKNEVTIYPAFLSLEIQEEVLRKIDFAKADAPNAFRYDSAVGDGYILLHQFSLRSFLKFAMKWHRVLICDENFYSTVASETWAKLAFTLKGKNQTLQDSEDAFSNYLHRHSGQSSAICFVTGPTFDTYKSVSWPQNTVKIICNSIVKNNEFLEYIGGPDLLVFADPVFHFCPNKYAEEFRKSVVKVFQAYRPYLAVPEHAYGLVKSFLPNSADRLIAVKCMKSTEWLVPKNGDIAVKATANILTLLMLPFARATAKDIYVLGADGRKKTETYFWHHSKTAQFNDLMEEAFKSHPSFFNDRIYEDYYDQHCESLKSQILATEASGQSVKSVTPSYIPALAERSINAT